MNAHRQISLAALLGLASIALGTVAEHLLQPRVEAEHVRYLMTAVRYGQFHAAVLLALALAALSAAGGATLLRGLRQSFLLMLIGTVLFGGSIFIAVISQQMGLTLLTPVGGGLMMAGWAWLAWVAVRHAGARP